MHRREKKHREHSKITFIGRAKCVVSTIIVMTSELVLSIAVASPNSSSWGTLSTPAKFTVMVGCRITGRGEGLKLYGVESVGGVCQFACGAESFTAVCTCLSSFTVSA